MMWLVAGLGNPGDKYAYTWHNLGFLTLEMIADRLSISLDKSKFKGVYGKGKIDSQEVFLMKPMTYMNNSGEAIQEICAYYKIPPEHVIVIYDDIDIPIGTIRVREKGTAGTHNGMRSVVNHMKTTLIPRVRIGSGPVPSEVDIISYVLGVIPKDRREEVYKAFEAGSDAVIDYIKKNK